MSAAKAVFDESGANETKKDNPKQAAIMHTANFDIKFLQDSLPFINNPNTI
jgi:hypothetical protein